MIELIRHILHVPVPWEITVLAITMAEVILLVVFHHDTPEDLL